MLALIPDNHSCFGRVKHKPSWTCMCLLGSRLWEAAQVCCLRRMADEKGACGKDTRAPCLHLLPSPKFSPWLFLQNIPSVSALSGFRSRTPFQGSVCVRDVASLLHTGSLTAVRGRWDSASNPKTDSDSIATWEAQRLAHPSGLFQLCRNQEALGPDLPHGWQRTVTSSSPECTQTASQNQGQEQDPNPMLP